MADRIIFGPEASAAALPAIRSERILSSAVAARTVKRQGDGVIRDASFESDGSRNPVPGAEVSNVQLTLPVLMVLAEDARLSRLYRESVDGFSSELQSIRSRIKETRGAQGQRSHKRCEEMPDPRPFRDRERATARLRRREA